MNNEKPKQHKFVRIIGLGMIILILSSGMYHFLELNNEAGDELINDKTLGERLDDKGWMVYTQTGCGACVAQKEILGNERFDIKIHDCGVSKEDYDICDAQGIVVIPTWHNVFSNETRHGVQSLAQLEEMAK